MILEKITNAVGIGKNPFASLTMWGLFLYQAASHLAPLLCGETFPLQLPAAWCACAETAITILGEILVILGIRRAVK